jgi:formylglycine-generating enzyme required for sulfatase activity/predicted Ser/Thr protein kinase
MGNPELSAETLFEEALDLPPEQRSAFLDGACRNDPAMRRAVEGLLADNDQAGGFLSESPVHAVKQDTGTDTATLIGLAAGTRLGRYVILEPLGSGGMGAVYRARDERLERAVALKIVSPEMLRGDELRRRFHKEALALAKLSHAHIAAVYDVGEQDGLDYIVMECIAGESLAAKLKAGPLTVKEATSILLQIAEALEEAHAAGIVHRDLKPANVMITPKGQVKVLDFGIAKLLTTPDDATLSFATRGLIGTPYYMSPEQASEKDVDARSDLWSLGVLYYESLTGRRPFRGDSNIGTLRAVVEQEPDPLRQGRPDAPAEAERIVTRALQKDPAKRYQTAVEMATDASDLLAGLTPLPQSQVRPPRKQSHMLAMAAVALLVCIVAGWWVYRTNRRRWAHDEALPRVRDLIATKKPVAAFALLENARKYLPGDPQPDQIAAENSTSASITSTPAGATVEIQDYSTPSGPWRRLGVTPLEKVTVPDGYFRWKVSKAGVGETVTAPYTDSEMSFALGAAQSWPEGMVYVGAQRWRGNASYAGFLGPYKMPAYYVDRYEVRNRDYQKFVDSGGYEKKEYWPAEFHQNGKDLTWAEAMARFRDATDRPGPSTWTGGHYPEGKADYPVSGVSWFEASAYAKFVGKTLPVLAQWMQIAPNDVSPYIVPASNMSSSALTPVGTYQGVGPYGTYDTAGNVAEWIVNSAENDLRMVMGGSWKSPGYQYFEPAALSPFDRMDDNGFRCVRNLGPLPDETSKPVLRRVVDFSHYKPVSDSVFHAYELMYAVPKMPLNATEEGVVKETVDWKEEKVSFDTGYRGERMSAYLFLPKNVRQPYQTVLFFPSARVYFAPDNQNGLRLADMTFFDYVIQSGRAVMYPIYQDTYERRLKFSLPSGAQNIQLTTDWYKDAARSLDYLATRQDIDSSKLAYMGVSMGSADGVIISELLQDRLKTAVFLDGGYFPEVSPPGADQADFVTRMKKPVLMVNGRYDYTFPLERAQNPFFAMLGTPEADKRHVVMDTPHDVREDRPQLTKEVLDWLDKYLGRVN